MKPTRSTRNSDPHNRSEDDGKSKGRRARPGWLGERLSVLAVALSLVAIVVAVLMPGPPGAGTIMAQGSQGGPVTIGSTCTHYPGAEVVITVPRAGAVVVSATVGVGINHTFAVADEARIVLATSDTDCAITDSTAFVSVPASSPQDSAYYVTVPLLRSFPVAGAGTYAFRVNGVMAQGADSYDRFDSASLVATFYPA